MAKYEDSFHHRGQLTLSEMGWIADPGDPTPPDSGYTQAFWDYTVENLWGRVWSRPGLALADRQIATLATLILLGEDKTLADHLRHCHTLGLSEERVRSVILLVGHYAGWPRLESAMLVFDRVLAEAESRWPAELRTPESSGWPSGPETMGWTREQWYKTGLETLVELGWIHDVSDRVAPNPDGDQAFWNFTIENLFGRAYSLPTLSIREKQIAVMATIAAHNSEEGLRTHLLRCHHTGLSEIEVREILIQVGYYVGWPSFSVNTMRFNRLLVNPSSDWPEDKRVQLPELGSPPDFMNKE